MAQGSYSDINATGFNIKDILESYNQAMKDKDDKHANTKEKYTDEIQRGRTPESAVKEVKEKSVEEKEKEKSEKEKRDKEKA